MMTLEEIKFHRKMILAMGTAPTELTTSLLDENERLHKDLEEYKRVSGKNFDLLIKACRERDVYESESKRYYKGLEEIGNTIIDLNGNVTEQFVEVIQKASITLKEATTND